MKKTIIQKDTIIIGGGIAGLYAGYRLYSNNFLILEKTNNVGGRIDTYHDPVFGNLEAGAGRFHAGHKRLLSLLKELNLDHLTIPINSADSDYYPRYGQGLHFPNSTTSQLIEYVLEETKKTPNNTLINTNFHDYASHILSEKQLKHIMDSFGFYVELREMNLLSFRQLYQEHYSAKQFFSLRGGLSQIIDKLETHLRDKIHTSTQVSSIRYPQTPDPNPKIIIETNTYTYICNRCICAIPVESLQRLSFFSPIYYKLRQINAYPLCRIYSKYNTKTNDHMWFNTIRKSTTNNMLRYIIPINYDKGIIMSSYTDSIYAKRWRDLLKEKGVTGIKTEISHLNYETFGVRTAKPTHTKVFYWPHGVGYWLVGADSHTLSRELIQPFNRIPVYICGEHISEKNQQWMEGALETVEKVLNKLN